MKKSEVEFMNALRKAGFSRSLCESVNTIRKAVFESNAGSFGTDIESVSFDKIFGLPSVTWKFTDEPITIISGLNGSGKTTLLNTIAYFLDGSSEFGSKIHDKFDSVTFETNNGTFKFTKDNLDEMAGKGNTPTRFVSANTEHCDEIQNVFDTEGSLESIAGSADVVNAFLDILNNLTKDSFIPKTYAIENGKVVIHSYPNDIRVKDLSDGERFALSIWYDVFFSPENVILIEEPERALHIIWQQSFVRDLERACELTGKRVFVTSHSPNILLDHKYYFALFVVNREKTPTTESGE